jgi:hypothetical protein
MENVNRRIAVEVSPDINTRPYLKNNQSKKGWELGVWLKRRSTCLACARY